MVIKYIAKTEGKRLDVFLSEESGSSRSHIKRMLDGGRVLVNGQPEKASYTVKAGDAIEAEPFEPVSMDVRPVDIPIDIVYEDEDLAVVNKPQGLTVHAGNGTDEHTLVNALLFRLKSLSGINGVIRPGIVHRIDKDTSGLLVVAKNDAAHIALAKQIENKTCHRVYLALLYGNLPIDSGRIDNYIERSEKDRKTFRVSLSNKGRRAVTDYRVIKRFKGYTLCEFSLLTGRTHQIRVHCKHMGCPVVGDKVYGPKKCAFNLNGQLLHAYMLTFIHPKTGKEMTFNAPLPGYFRDILEKLEEI